MGAIPITSRHPNSSMPEVCGRYDLGPFVPKFAESIQSDARWFGLWRDALIEAATTTPEELIRHRRRRLHAIITQLLCNDVLVTYTTYDRREEMAQVYYLRM